MRGSNTKWILLIGLNFQSRTRVYSSLFDRLAQLRKSQDSDDFFEQNLFTISQFVYQSGVLIARSSLYWFRSKATGIINFILFLHFLAFFGFCLFYISINIWIIFSLSFTLGIFGGWGYLFSYYRLMDNEEITENNREILINYLAISADLGALIEGINLAIFKLANSK